MTADYYISNNIMYCVLRDLTGALCDFDNKKHADAQKKVERALQHLMPKPDDKKPVLKNVWGKGKCCATENKPIFKDDAECYCGCIKHHYHCTNCGRLTQVG